MALVVEDGTGVTGGNAYVSVANANAYHTLMGNTAWTGTDAVKEVAILRATQYMDISFVWRGVRISNAQPLEWPRVDYWVDADRDDNVWPPRGLVEACCELALRALTGELIVDIEDDRQIKKEKIGPIETEYERGTNGGQVAYPKIARLLRGLTRGSTAGRSRPIVRTS